MFKIKIISVGKNKEEWLEDALDEYVKRLKPVANIEFMWAKDDQQLLNFIEKESNVVGLDPNGLAMDSEVFADKLQKILVNGGSRAAFVIGGSEGLPKEMKSKYPLISLSKLTFTHQITRLILIEQIYRAFEIAKGSKYHRGSSSVDQ